MLFENLRKKRYIDKHVKESLEIVFSKLEIIRENSSVLAICPKPTGSNFKGVNVATKNLFKGQTFEIAQLFSEPVYDSKELNSIISFIIKLNFSQVIFSGIPAYFEFLIEELASKTKNVQIGVFFHGYLSEMSGDARARANFFAILKLLSAKKIHKVGFNKKGLAETMNNFSGLNFNYLMVKTPDFDYMPIKSTQKLINIGVLGSNSFRKNIHNQVAASLLISDSMVHVIEKQEFDYLGLDNRIIEHGFIEDHNKYLDVLSLMDINLYISFSESWGLVTLESLAMGIPCLVGSSGNVYDWDLELKELFVVKDYDDSYAISKKIEQILNNKNISPEMLKNYVKKLNTVSDGLLEKFLTS